MDGRSRSKRALNDLDHVFRHVIRGIENGLLEATKYFEPNSLAIDPFVFSVLVRLHARNYLQGRELEAIDEEQEQEQSCGVSPAFEVERVNLCGLLLKIGRYRLKIWKFSLDDVRKALHRQRGEQLVLVDDNQIPIREDLAICWAADESNHLAEVHLVQPNYFKSRCLEWIWSRSIFHIPSTLVSIDAGDIPVQEISVETTHLSKT